MFLKITDIKKCLFSFFCTGTIIQINIYVSPELDNLLPIIKPDFLLCVVGFWVGFFFRSKVGAVYFYFIISCQWQVKIWHSVANGNIYFWHIIKTCSVTVRIKMLASIPRYTRLLCSIFHGMFDDSLCHGSQKEKVTAPVLNQPLNHQGPNEGPLDRNEFLYK